MKTAVSIATVLVLAAPLAMSQQAERPAAEQSPQPSAEVQQSTLDALARDVERVESLREVKDIQRQYAQLAQFGQWNEMADLFADDGVLQWGDEVVERGSIAQWLEADAGAFDGIGDGSLHTSLIDQPLVNLSVDGATAEGRWAGLRYLGDGEGATRIDGGIYENRYVLEDGGWKISELVFHPYHDGDYETAFRTIGGEAVQLVPYHFTPDSAGVPVPEPEGEAAPTEYTASEVAARIDRLGDEDEVRNLQHAYGYYLDQRMWTDVVDLFARDSSVTIDGVGVFEGPEGVREAMERMGPEGLEQGVLNDRPQFDAIVEIAEDGRTAVARGTEVGMLSDADGSGWEFSVFRNDFVKEDGVWKLSAMNITPLLTATHEDGWGDGGVDPGPVPEAPAFLDVTGRALPASGEAGDGEVDLVDAQRRLDRAVAFDGAENVSAAYSYYIDDSRWHEMAAIHAADGHKLSPFAGWNLGRERILESVTSTYGDEPPPTEKSFLVTHWRPQPVIHVSEDGRSVSYRSRLMHLFAAPSESGYIRGGMYNDEMVLEDGIWRLWSTNIEEFYWESSSWADGWGNTEPRDPSLPDPPPSDLIDRFPPDLLHSELGERSRGFRGGSPGYIQWPDIVPMWFHYRNPVSGRIPPNYWPDCAPCLARPDWRMTEHGYQKPPTGPEIDATVRATRLDLGPLAIVVGTARNDELVPVDITLSTEFGERTYSDVRPGRTVVALLYGRSSEEGTGAEASVTAVYSDEEGYPYEELERTLTASYRGH